MGSLTDIFAKTDTISYGPFQISKRPGAPWGEATATIEGRHLCINPSEKRLLALLISREGGIVQHADLAFEQSPQARSRNASDRVMKVHVHNLKKKIRAAVDIEDGAPLAAMIRSVNEARKGSKGTPEERDARRTGYRLIPEGP